ncbi:MAG: phosphoglycerate kinase [Pseudomonadota bacterium]
MSELAVLTMDEVSLTNQRVLIREDLNVPIRDGVIQNDARLQAALPTIRQALASAKQVIVTSHLGRPKEGEFDQEFSLAPIAEYLSQHLGMPVPLVSEWRQGLSTDLKNSKIILLENIRFQVGEKKNDENLSKALAELCDVFVMDAFGTAHRAQSSTYGAAEYARVACAGPLLVRELISIAKVLANPKRPLIAIVGGSKVSTKLKVLNSLAQQVDHLIVGGGIANTFLAAQGYDVGKSLMEADWLDEARRLMSKTSVLLPIDVVVATEISAHAKTRTIDLNHIQKDEMILDIGPKSAENLVKTISQSKTILWNGPVGVFELEPFQNGTRALAEAIAKSDAFSLAGGGDTLAAIEAFNIQDQISYASTGGGAFLEMVEGNILPAVEILQKRFQQSY